METSKRNDGKETGYGLGVAVRGKGKDLKIYHGGKQSETRTYLEMIPGRQTGVVVMTNSSYASAEKIGRRIQSIIARSREKKPG